LQIHLIEPETGSSDPTSTSELSVRTDHLALHVDDTHAPGELLDQHGLPYKTNTVADTGVTQYFFQDPDGNHIEIGTYAPARLLTSEL
jgi:catechol 2,3-dioxygenase-like lactoylglutathione lyase family enzyme